MILLQYIISRLRERNGVDYVFKKCGVFHVVKFFESILANCESDLYQEKSVVTYLLPHFSQIAVHKFPVISSIEKGSVQNEFGYQKKYNSRKILLKMNKRTHLPIELEILSVVKYQPKIADFRLPLADFRLSLVAVSRHIIWNREKGNSII